MSRVASGILAAAAATFAFGAVHLAGASSVNNRLMSDRLNDTGLSVVADIASTVNRAAKADRVPGAAIDARSVTMAFEVPALPNTTLIVRVPTENAASNMSPKTPERSSPARRTTACEPSVSVLTAIAKQLQPSRCLA